MNGFQPSGEQHSQDPQSQQDQVARLTRVTLVVGTLLLGLAVFTPFWSQILWAAILCYALYSPYRWALRSLSAFVMCVAVTLGLILPLVYLSLLIADGLAETLRRLVQVLQNQGGLVAEGKPRHSFVALFSDQIGAIERLTGTDLRASLIANLNDLTRLVLQQLTRVGTQVVQALVNLGIVLICAFYFFRDGERIMEWVQDTLPLTAERQRQVIRIFRDVVKGAVYGNTLVALLEGIIGGIAFWVLGLPSAVLCGALMGILAYLPLVGAAVIWVPGAVYLYVQAAYVKAAILFAAGAVIAVIDHIVRTIVVGEASKLHTLLVFFGVLGGLKLFGFVGVVAGPLVVAGVLTILEAYRLDQTPELVHSERREVVVHK